MWKYGVAAFGMFGMAMAVSNGLRSTAVASRGDAGKSVETILQEVADDQNAQRGDPVLSGMIRDGAEVRGHTIVLNFIIPRVPRNYNGEEASRRAQREMAATYCRKLGPLLKRGAIIVHRFRSHRGLDLIDGRLDAAGCERAL